MSKLWRVKHTYKVSLHIGAEETRTEVWSSNLTEDAARLMADFENRHAQVHRRPKHPSLIKPGEGLCHEDDVFVAELMPRE
jgi:hypothetical protein